MCGSSSMPGAGGMNMLAAGFNAFGALREGGQEKAFRDAEALQLEADAKAAAGQGIVNADIIRKAGKRQRGTARAALAGAGVVVDAGSGRDVQDFITEQSELDAISEMMTGRRTAERLNAQGSQQRIAGQVAMKNANWRAAGSFIEGGAKAKAAWDLEKRGGK